VRTNAGVDDAIVEAVIAQVDLGGVREVSVATADWLLRDRVEAGRRQERKPLLAS
jgi:hypothetical protein